MAEAIENVEQAYDVAARKLFGIQTEEMLELRDRVLELLEQT